MDLVIFIFLFSVFLFILFLVLLFFFFILDLDEEYDVILQVTKVWQKHNTYYSYMSHNHVTQRRL